MITSTSDRQCISIERRDIAHGTYAGDPVRLLFVAPGCRIDNAAHLAREIGLGAAFDFPLLLVEGWRLWGTGLAQQLRGAFSFILHDSSAQCLYVARDHFGLAPLFLCERQDCLYFGCSSQLVRALLPQSLPDDELMLADFVTGVYLERARTFFRGIERFPEAHWATYRPNGTQHTRYWSLAASLSQKAPDHPVERFRALMDRSVRACIIPRQTGLMLSGGLDSSAIAASAAMLGGPPMLTLSLTYKQTPGWNDDRHLAAVAAQTGLDPIEFPSDRHNPLEDMEFWLSAVDGPYLPRGHSVSFRLLKIARERGIKVLLSGHGGDEVVSYGFGRLNELGKARRWWRLWLETRGAADLYGDPRLPLFRRYLSHIHSLRPLIRRLSRGAVGATAFDRRFLSEAAASALPAGRYDIKPLANRLDHNERMLHEEALGHPLQPGSLEVFALCSDAAGLETRLPFYDVDLVEFSLSLPSEWKLQNGYSRYILRRAYAGDLPDETLRRRDKFDFTVPFIAGLVDQRDKVLDLTGSDLAHRWGLVNRDALNLARDNLYRNGTGIDRIEAFFLWRVTILAMWAEVSRQPLAAPVMIEVT